LNHISLKDFHLPLNADQAKFDEVKNLIRQAGLDFYAVGVIYMKTESEVEAAFDYAKNAGVRMIVGVPSHDLLDLTEKKIKEYDITLAIHNHGPGDLLYPTCESAFRKVDGRDPRFGLCLDVGHAFRAGEDPAGAVKAYGRRILDIHLKDVDAAGIKGTTVEMGRGTIDLPALIRAVEQTGYGGNLPIEYEKDGDNPIPGLAESVGYFRGLLRGR
jgi:sugar phosphate isomerase/epimerase